MAITLKCHTTSLGIATIYLPEPDYYKGLKGSGQKSGVSLRRSFDCDSKAAVHWLIGNQIPIKSYKNKTIARRQRNTPQHIDSVAAVLTLNHSFLPRHCHRDAQRSALPL